MNDDFFEKLMKESGGGDAGGKEADLIKGALKSEEEIEKFSLSNALSDIERMMTIIKNGQPLQLESLYVNLDRYVFDCDDPEEAFAKISPHLKAIYMKLKAGESESVISISSSLIRLVGYITEGKLSKLTLASITNKIGAAIEKCITLCTEMPCCDVVGDLYLSLLPVFLEVNTEDKVIAFVLSNLEGSSSECRKIFACKVVGRFCEMKYVNPTNFVNKVLDRSLRSCQDTSCNVRMTMCDQLVFLIKVLPQAITNDKIFPEIIELLNDEDKDVIVRAIESVVKVMEYVNIDKYLSLIHPVLLKNINDVDASKFILQVLAANLGAILQKLVETFLIKDITFIKDFYLSLYNAKESFYCYALAFNFPAIIKYVNNNDNNNFRSVYLPIWVDLLKNGNEKIKVSLCTSYSVVISLISPKEAFESLSSYFFTFFEDADSNINNIILTQLNAVMVIFNSPSISGDAKIEFNNNVLLSLLKYGNKVKSYWRDQKLFLESIKEIHGFIDLDKAQKPLMPLMYEYLKISPSNIKEITCHIICILLKNVSKNSIRKEMINKIKSEYGMSPSFSDRITFGIFVRVALLYFSYKFARSNFLDIVIERIQDKIILVKLSVLPSLPLLIRSFSIPIDVILKERIEGFVKSIIETKSLDVNYPRLQELSISILKQLKETPLSPKFEPKNEIDMIDNEKNKSFEIYENLNFNEDESKMPGGSISKGASGKKLSTVSVKGEKESRSSTVVKNISSKEENEKVTKLPNIKKENNEKTKDKEKLNTKSKDGSEVLGPSSTSNGSSKVLSPKPPAINSKTATKSPR